jgi:uncharacterized protein (TIGR02300 family)
VAKAELGAKRECQSCGTKYYDLGKEPPVCPRCGTVFSATAPKASAAPVEKPKPKPKPEPRVAPVAAEGDEAEPIVADEEAEFVDDEEEFVEEEAEEEEAPFEPEPEEK